jgi:hypothetical protein
MKCMPQVCLSSTLDDDVLELYPAFANELRLLVVVENGDFELEVVGGFVDGETELLVPAQRMSAW